MKSITWSLEVIRGRDTGHTYALAPGEMVLGNALNGTPGLDLGRHEGDGPRKMAARQASLRRSEQGLALQDLESPGGTFVNRQRLLPGQSRTLQLGDVIQLGSVQLKVVGPSHPVSPEPISPSAVAPPSKPNPPPPIPSTTTTTVASKASTLPTPFVLASGATCRTWDDFLTISAQRWASLRDELSSGR
ncbi:FHA domain-containing protein, partial [Singulisphaera rosea]